METNEGNIKPQQTGGLKLMTVFIAVLALHVVVIGGFTVYHLMSGGSTDADLLGDKTHKSLKDGALASDGQSPDATSTDKSAVPTTTPTDVATIPAPTPAPDQAPAPTPAPDTAAMLHTATPAPAPTPAPATMASKDVPTMPNPAPLNTLAPPADVTPAPIAPAPVATSGPVKMPAIQPAPAPEKVTGTIYVVKITDSYKKIAHDHHLTIAQLKSANNIKGDVLHTGQKLLIPGKTELASNVAPSPEPVATPNLLGDNTAILSAPAPASIKTMALTSSTPVASSHVYTVIKGDTLSKIAHKFKTTPAALMAANNITDPTKLSIGKKLKIPSQEARSATNAPAAPAAAQPSQAKADATSAQLANFVR